jgi:hypothetical protein
MEKEQEKLKFDGVEVDPEGFARQFVDRNFLSD